MILKGISIFMRTHGEFMVAELLSSTFLLDLGHFVMIPLRLFRSTGRGTKGEKKKQKTKKKF